MANDEQSPSSVCPQNLTVSTDVIKVYGTFLYAFGFIFTFVCYGTYMLARRGRRFNRLQSRHPLLTHVLCFGALLHLQLDPLALMIGREHYYCGAMVLQFMIIPLLGGPVVARLLSFYFKSRFESQAMENFRQSLRTREQRGVKSQRAHDGRPSFEGAPEEEYDRRLSTLGIVRAFTFGFRDAFLFLCGGRSWANDNTKVNLRTLRFLHSGHGISFVIFAVLLMPAFFAAVIVAAVDPTFVAGCVGCEVPLAVSSFLLVQSGFISLMTMLLVLRIRRERIPDRWGVLTETLLSIAFAGIGILGYALLTHVQVGRNWDFTFMLSFGIWGMVFVQTALQLYFAMTRDRVRPSRRHRNKRALQQSISTSALNSAHFNLNVVLGDKVLAKAFEDHLQREFGVESLFFYQEAKAWKHAYPDMSPATRATRARKIINSFIRPDGIFCVNIPSVTTREILNVTDGAVLDPTFPKPELFDDAVEEVRDLLEMGALARFKRSETFKALIAEGLQHLAPMEF